MDEMRWLLKLVIISALSALLCFVVASASQAVPTAQISPTTVNLGNVNKGSSGTATFTVTNSGDGTLSISSITPSNSQFTVSPTLFNLAAGASQTVTVTFRPTVVGWEQSNLTITHNGPGPTTAITASGIGRLTLPTTGLLANTRIAFMSGRDGNNEIYVMNPDGTNQTQLTNNPAVDQTPSWSPDGTKIAFYSDRDGDNEIYVMNADGTGTIQLTNNSGYDVSPSWSPDGTKILFESAPDVASQQDIWVMNADGTNLINLTNTPSGDGTPSWSPDGTKIAFQSIRSGHNEIWVMNADGTNPVNLTNNGQPGDAAPNWSPDGTKIVFSFTPPGGTGDIYVMNADGTNLIQLTNNTADDANPSWSPDGTKITFVSNRDGNYEIYIMNADGTNQTRLTTNTAVDQQPSWSRFLPVFKYRITGRRAETESGIVITPFPLTTADETQRIAAIPVADKTAAGLSYVVASFDLSGNIVRSARKWVKITNATASSDQPVGNAAVAPLSIPDSTKVVEVDSPANLIAAKRQFYRFFSIPVAVSGDLNSILGNLGTFTPPTVPEDISKRKTGFFISNFKSQEGIWTTASSDVNLKPGAGGIIRAARAANETVGINKFIQLTGSSTPPEGIKDDNATGKLNRTAVEPAHTGVDVELKPGWNIVGAPMYRRFFWSITGGIRVIDTNGVDIGAVGSSLANAFASPLIFGGYDGAEYKRQIDASNISIGETEASRVMQPFEGYWVFAFNACKLRFLAAAGGPDSLAAPPASGFLTEKERITANGGWGISLLARTINSVDAGNIIGYGLKEVEYMKPPSLFEDDVRLSILGEDGLELTRSLTSRVEGLEDFVGALLAAPYWDIKVDATGDVPVTISGEMLNLPKEYQVILIGSDGVEVANLREAPYTYIPKHSGIEIFKVVVTKKRLIPKVSALLQNYPNPFNPETWIPYQLSKAGDVVISIYNVQGQLVRRLSLGYKEAGVYIRKEETAYWDGRNGLGERVTSGIYFYSLQAGQFVATRKMVVVK